MNSSMLFPNPFFFWTNTKEIYCDLSSYVQYEHNLKNGEKLNDSNEKNWKICPIDNKSLNELIKGTIAKLSEDSCYPEYIRAKISSYEKIFWSLCLKRGDAEKYFQDYYSKIV